MLAIRKLVVRTEGPATAGYKTGRAGRQPPTIACNGASRRHATSAAPMEADRLSERLQRDVQSTAAAAAAAMPPNQSSLNTESTKAGRSGTPSPDAPDSSQRGVRQRRQRSPPTSLPDYARKKGSLSVTDMVSPLWCEYAYQYNILGMSHLPIEDRPKEFTTPQGATVKPNVGLTHKREKILDAGRTTHERLEREIYPVQVRVQTVTRDDVWALKLLQLVSGIKTLLMSGCCRELPVFGFIKGTFVTGIIDEISKRPLPRHLLRYLDAPKTEVAVDEGPKLDRFFSVSTSQSSRGDTGNTTPTPNSSQTSAKSTKWASQEEWKKDKRRRELADKRVSKPKATSPRKSARLATPTAGQAMLASFFGGNSSQQQGTGIDAEASKNQHQERFGYFVEDSKTRKHRLAPDVEDQQPSRLQCMLYKRLIDGLLAGCGPLHNPPQERARAARVLQMDEFADATPVERIFAFLGLDAEAPLSDAFRASAGELVAGLDIDLFGPEDGVCTLGRIGEVMQAALLELAESARRGVGWTEPVGGVTGTIQEQLFLTYRKRRQGKKSKSRLNGHSSRQKDRDRATGRRAALDEMTPKTPKALAPESEAGEDTQIAFAADAHLGVSGEGGQNAAEVHKDGSTPIPQALVLAEQDASKPEPEQPLGGDIDLTQSSTASKDDDSAGNESGNTRATRDSDIITRVRFVHAPRTLEAHVRHVLELLRGERPPEGVSLAQSWRCWPCAFRDDCEWRDRKGRERLDEAARARISAQAAGGRSAAGAATVAVAVALDDESSGSSSSDGEHAAPPVEEDSGPGQLAPQQRQGALAESGDASQDDEALWSQFDELPDDLAW